jgi:exodeoxyribonuclease VII small subunit
MNTKPFEFEAALKELEDITAWFESGEVDLDQGLVKFERGMELAQQLKSHLATVENRIEKIKQRFAAAPASGSPDTPPTETEDTNTSQAGLFGV